MSKRIKSNPFHKESNRCRYFFPENITEISERFIRYENAEKCVDEISTSLLSKKERITTIVNGSFIFGDFIEAFVIKNKLKIKKMTLSTLSYSENNVDSLKNLMLYGYVDNLNLIVSDYFFGHERANLIPYTYNELDNEHDTFQLAIERTHCKVYIFETYDEKYFVIQGSVNLRSSGNTENFTIEENKTIYTFFDNFLSEIIQRNKTINKSLKFKKSWQADRKSTQEEAGKKQAEAVPAQQKDEETESKHLVLNQQMICHSDEFMFSDKKMSKKIKLTDFSVDENNFNRHTEAGMELLENSIKKVGVIESITVSADDKIISGNARQEKIGVVLGEDVEPIVVETDGRKPVILKRTDIQSGTKQFTEAALLANTTAKKNISLDWDLIQDIAVEEFEIDVLDLGIDVLEFDCSELDNLSENTLREQINSTGQTQLTFVFEKEHKEAIDRYMKLYGKKRLQEEVLKIIQHA